MRQLTRALCSRGRDEDGFTMVIVLGIVLVVTLLSIAALSAAQGDLGPGAHDRERKVSYAAAEAGVQNYLFHLSQDPNYWAKCTTGAQPQAVNDPWNGVAPAIDPRTWMSLPSSRARYTIELLAANGAAACSPSDPDATMIDAASGTFKIRATGEDFPGGLKRSIVTTFKRQSLLDYLYFTDKETYSAGLYPMNVAGTRTRESAGAGDIVTWGRRACDRYWGGDPLLGNRGGAPTFDGQYLNSAGTWVAAPAFACSEIGFTPGDALNGPVHTNDEILVDCAANPVPSFGDSIDDVVETSSLGQPVVSPADPRGGWRGCSAPTEPYVNFPTTSPARAAGTWRPRAAPVQLPLTNASLLHDAAPAYRFKGTTKIAMHGTTMQVTTAQAPGSPVEMAIPADGVVYVANDGACPEYTPIDSGAAPVTCGNLELQGDYAASATFSAENDILVKNSVTRTSSGSQFLLGLIAQNFVRVHHPVKNCDPASACNLVKGCTNAAGTPTNVSITAAILSLTRSFIVDNWFCGAPLGTLTVYGAIAQKYRGPTGRREITGSTVVTTGYFDGKDYHYDSRFKYRSPPHFPDPVQAQWRVQTFSEQAPAR
jgi:hypothetical protein